VVVELLNFAMMLGKHRVVVSCPLGASAAESHVLLDYVPTTSSVDSFVSKIIITRDRVGFT
jgi:hypothetical protein